MGNIDHVRSLLRDRNVKAGARGTIEETVALDVALVEEYNALEAEVEALDQRLRTGRTDEQPTKPAKKRLSDAPPTAADPTGNPELDDLRQQLTDKGAEVRASSLKLVFRSLGSTAYQRIVNRHPEADDNSEARAAFLNDVLRSSLHQVSTLDGDQLDGLGWDEVYQPDGEDGDGPLSYGEWESLASRVAALNRRKVDLPFSLRSSGPTPA